jgi:hypothetical protein
LEALCAAFIPSTGNDLPSILLRVDLIKLSEEELDGIPLASLPGFERILLE